MDDGMVRSPGGGAPRSWPALRSTCAVAALIAVALALALASPAAAATPATATIAHRVDPLAGGSAIGQLSFRTTFTDGSATGTAVPSPLRLELGSTYRIRTCVWAKAPGKPPQSVCQEADTRPNALTVVTGSTAPTAQLTVDRPAAGQQPATITGVVLVDRVLPGGAQPAALASSWPGEGLPAAGVAVPAVDEVAGPVLGPQGVAVPGERGGGINTGTQDSICREDQVAPDQPDAGSTSALGELPFAYEVGEPAGGRPARGVMLTIHGGAWSSVGRAKLSLTRGDAERWRARGWRTVNATYRSCGASVADVLTLYDRVRAKYGQSVPICALGRSAGGQLALLLAVRRPRLACVVAVAAIADLPALAHQSAAAGTTGPRRIFNWATAAFGADRLREVSAAGSPVAARVLYAIAADDSLVPYEQATAFAAAQRRLDRSAYVDTMRLASGDARFEHAFVSEAALAEFQLREQALVLPLAVGDVIAPERVRLKILRSNGLRARFSCAARCTISARLELSTRTAKRFGVARVLGRSTASRGSRGHGMLTVRLSKKARARIAPATAQLVTIVSAGGQRRRQTASIVLRRP
jgi:acetyl esterase/lipase